jgi:diacylglycerol kinase family enzyme
MQAFLDEARALAGETGHELRLIPTGNPGEGCEAAERAADKGFDTLWIGGGDGTINQLVGHTLGRGLNYGVVPLGTVNALARSVGIPLDPLSAVRFLLRARPVAVDAGTMNDRLFLCFASVGFDAAAVHEVGEGTRLRFKRLAHVLAGVRVAARKGALAPFAFETPGRTETGHSLILGNIGVYAGVQMFRAVAPSSGNMEYFLFRGDRVLPVVALFAGSKIGVKNPVGARRDVVHDMTTEFTLRSERPMFLQLDGEPVSLGDNREYRFRCLPGAVKMLLEA